MEMQDFCEGQLMSNRGEINKVNHLRLALIMMLGKEEQKKTLHTLVGDKNCNSKAFDRSPNQSIKYNSDSQGRGYEYLPLQAPTRDTLCTLLLAAVSMI